MLWFMGSQKVGHDCTELNVYNNFITASSLMSAIEWSYSYCLPRRVAQKKKKKGEKRTLNSRSELLNF